MAQGNPYARFVEVMKRQGGGMRETRPPGWGGKEGGSGRVFGVWVGSGGGI